MMRDAGFLIVLAGLSVAAGVGIGWLVHPPAVIIERPAAEIKQDDGSLVIEKAPNSEAKPKHKIPKRAKVERVIEVTALGQGITLPSGQIAPCPPITLDLSLVRELDGQRRVVASARDGKILKAMDIPVESAPPAHERLGWAAGMSIDPIRQGVGAWVEKDIGRVRVGADINQVRAAVNSGIEARVRVGWVF